MCVDDFTCAPDFSQWNSTFGLHQLVCVLTRFSHHIKVPRHQNP